MSCRRPWEAGFTLLELLISLTLLGGLGVVMFGGLWYGLQTWHRATVFDERADDMTVVRHALQQSLGRAYPLYLGAEKPPATDVVAAAAARQEKPGIAFVGTPSAIQFLAPTPQSLGGAGMTRFQLRVTVSENAVGYSLVMRAQPELTNAPDQWITSTILDHAKEILFSYYTGNIDSSVSPKWLKHWEHQAMLPKLIRMSVAFPGFKWPDVTIAPRIAVDASCTVDPGSMTCSGR